MKRIFTITLLVFFVSSAYLKAQSFPRTFVQLGVGVDPVTHGGNTFTVKPEAGIDFGWFNISLSGILTTNTLFRNENFSLNLWDEVPPSPDEYGDFKRRTAFSAMLNVGIDFIKIFKPESKHGFLLGAGGGYTQLNLWTSHRGADGEFLYFSMKSGLDYCLSASYQYQISEKWRLGIYTDLQGMAEYTTFGINLKRYLF
jgi:hypothetical protein